MKPIPLLFATLSLVTTLAGAAAAHPRSIDRREARQHMRVQEGWRNGSLTRGEAMRLRAGQRRVHRMERYAWRDGVVTPRERYHLQRSLDRQSHRIYRFKHNGRST